MSPSLGIEGVMVLQAMGSRRSLASNGIVPHTKFEFEYSNDVEVASDSGRTGENSAVLW